VDQTKKLRDVMAAYTLQM